MLSRLAVAGALVLAVLPAAAHDSWISNGGYRSPATNEWCCGDVDCEVIPKERVHITAAGYVVTVPVDLEGHMQAETVPFSETLPSQDGQYWRCHRVDGKRRCFFAPPGQS